MPSTKRTKENTGSVMDKSSITLGTLAQSTSILSAGPAMKRGGRLLSTSSRGGINGLTAGDGPLIWGLMNSDLSQSELEAYLELEGPTSPSDVTATETASRGKRIRILGSLGQNHEIIDLEPNHSLSGLQFSEEDETTTGWTTFIYNLGPALTTGAEFDVLHELFVRWNPSG